MSPPPSVPFRSNSRCGCMSSALRTWCCGDRALPALLAIREVRSSSGVQLALHVDAICKAARSGGRAARAAFRARHDGPSFDSRDAPPACLGLLVPHAGRSDSAPVTILHVEQRKLPNPARLGRRLVDGKLDGYHGYRRTWLLAGRIRPSASLGLRDAGLEHRLETMDWYIQQRGPSEDDVRSHEQC